MVCMSDTHSKLYQLEHAIPDGDVFVHAGDFSQLGRRKEVLAFNDFLGGLPHRHKVVIAGNHECSFDPVGSGRHRPDVDEDMSELLTNCIYLKVSPITDLASVWKLTVYLFRTLRSSSTASSSTVRRGRPLAARAGPTTSRGRS